MQCINKLYLLLLCDNSEATFPDSKVHGAPMEPTLGRQDPGGPHVRHVNLAIPDKYS